MKWYEDLFVGESVTGKIKKIKWKIEHNAGMLHTYIITFPSNEPDQSAGAEADRRYRPKCRARSQPRKEQAR